jgi:RND family efflux transporter MFP subunit
LRPYTEARIDTIVPMLPASPPARSLPMLSRRIFLFCLTLAAVGVASARAQSSAAPPAALATAAVELREVADVYTADAVIESLQQATVSAQIGGTVLRFMVDAGDRVRRGQVLALIDTRDADAQLAATRAGVAQAEASLAQARLNHERSASLVRQGFISQSALDRADADLKTAQAALDAARAGSTQAATARGHAELRAPIDGVVSQRLMEPGELAAPGKPVLTLHDPAQLRAVGAIPQFMLSRVQVARGARVQAGEGAFMTAARLVVLPAADARLLSTVVRADLGREVPATVVPGMAAKILLEVGRARRLVLPAQAVIRRSELTAVYVVGADGRPQLRQIRVGELVADGLIEVLAGLAAGERVALDPRAAGAQR